MKILLSLFLLFSTLLYAQESVALKEEKTEKKVVFIEVSDVTKKASIVLQELKTLEEKLDTDEEAKKLEKKVKPYALVITQLLENEDYASIEFLSLRDLRKMQGELSGYLKQLSEWDITINEKVKQYDLAQKKLFISSSLWQNTYANAQEQDIPQELLSHISLVGSKIAYLEKVLKLKYDKALTNSQIVSTNILTLKEILKKLKEAENIANSKLFYQNQANIFESSFSENFSLKNYILGLGTSIRDKNKENIEYLKSNDELWLYYFLLASFSGIFVFYYNYLYRKRKLFVSKVSIGKKLFFFIGRASSTYIILLVLVSTLIFPERPSSFTQMILLILLIPVIRILQTVVNKESYKYIYYFCGLYFIWLLGENANTLELEGRLLTLTLNIFLLSYLVMAIHKKALDVITQSQLEKIVKALVGLFVGLLSISIMANIYGSVLLSQRIVNGVFDVLFASFVFYVLYVILTGYIIVILRRRIATASHMLDKYSKNIENTTSILIKVWMILWWLLIVSKLLSIYPYLVLFKENVMAFSIHIGEAVISIEAIFSFIIIVVGTWAVARLTRTVFEVEVFARFKLPRGMPTAILTTLNYVIVISGTIIAFSSLGVSAEQFALIFGALGVGIGFGLRNIIANFVSGVIMVFERPVQIGDTIEISNTMGNVQSIGARSSTIKTFDGSEVIIPNADFIAKEIINWTLSDEHRRKTVEFKVDLDSNVENILEIMKSVAMAHKDVLVDPEPLAALKSFGDYYLEFKLYFWLSDNLIVAHSEVTLNLYKALKEAGVSMPVPKLDYNKHVT